MSVNPSYKGSKLIPSLPFFPTQAMIIAFTSDMIPRLVYYWSFSIPPYGDHLDYSMEGYINISLSIFNTADFKSGVKENPYAGSKYDTCRQVLLPSV